MLRSGAFLISTANRMNVSRETFACFMKKTLLQVWNLQQRSLCQ